MNNEGSDIQLITRQKLIELLTISAATLWRYEQQNDFPAKIILGPSRVAYRQADIEIWLNSKKSK
jgi:predicted DNA-binding transcriptional regulator AlpA